MSISLLTEEDQDILEGHDASYLVIPIHLGYAPDTMGIHDGSQLMQTLVHGDVDRLWRHDLVPLCALNLPSPVTCSAMSRSVRIPDSLPSSAAMM
jgi:hypothetical protein